jgi:hypothetical protein
LVRATGEGDADAATVVQAALPRWLGYTVNVTRFADALGDDVAVREAMLAQRQDWARPLGPQGVRRALRPLA